jgi:hypothetical protein
MSSLSSLEIEIIQIGALKDYELNNVLRSLTFQPRTQRDILRLILNEFLVIAILSISASLGKEREIYFG